MLNREGIALFNVWSDIVGFAPKQSRIAENLRNPRTRCRVADIQVLENLDLKKFSGIWYDLGRLPQRHERALPSPGVSDIKVDPDGRIQIRYSHESDGECTQPVTLYGSQQEPSSKFQLTSLNHRSPSFLRGPYWVVDTDYDNFALIYGCHLVSLDGTCHRRHRLVYVIGRKLNIPREAEERLRQIVTRELCVDTRKLVFFHHMVGCESVVKDPTLNYIADSPQDGNLTDDQESKKCQFTDFPGHKDFLPSEVVGTWYILASYTLASVQASSMSSASFFLKHTPEGGFDSYFTTARNGRCLSQTYHGVLKKTFASLTEYYADYGKKKGPFKFVYFTSSYKYGLTYHCIVQNMDGTCSSASIDLIGRSQEFTEGVMQELKAKATSLLCADEMDFSLISQQELCPLRLGDKSKCQVDNIKSNKKIDWKSLQGYWYTTAAYRDSGRPSLTWYIDLWSYTAFRMHSRYAQNGQCIETKTSVVNFEPGGGTYHYKNGSQTFSPRILFLDGNNVVIVYNCLLMLSDGTCDPDNILLQFNTRSRHISRFQLQAFKSLLDDACIQMDDLTFIDHNVNCDPTPQEQMYFERCVIDEIPVKQKLHIEKMSGHWHSLSVSGQKMQLESVEIDVLSDGEGGAYLWYSGAKNGQCVTTSKAHLSPRHNDSRGEFTVHYSRFSSLLKVVSTDYEQYALLYECGQEDDQGMCLQGHESVEVLGRDHVKSVPDLSSLGKDLMKKTCFSLQDVKPMDNEISCHPVKGPEFCKIKDMPTQPGFVIKQLLGTWYRVGINRERNHMNNVQLHIVLNGMNRVAVSLSYAIDTNCEPGKTMLGSISKENAAVLYMNYGRSTGTAVVSYLDKDFAVLYHCNKVLADGTCEKLHHYVSVIARKHRLRGEALQRKDSILRQYLPDMCTDPMDIADITHTGMCTPMINHGKCKIDTLPVLRNFDIKQFLGTWYPIVKLKGSHTLDGSVMKFVESQDGQYHVYSTGVGHLKDRCLPTTKGTLTKPLQQGAELYISYGQTKGRIRVIFTNYDVALLYTCDYETEDGRCFAGQTSVDILSRSRNPDQDLKYPLLRRVKDLCEDPKDMVDVDHSTVECQLDPDHGCTVDEIPVADNIQTSQILGTWYSAAKLRGDASWESGVIHFSLRTNPTTHIEARITASRRGVCVPTKQTKLYRGSQAGVMHVGAQDSHKLLKVVALKENHALLYQCDKQTADAHCAPHHTYIDILSRDRQPLPDHIISEFAELAYTHLCHQRSEFTLTSHDVMCEVDLTQKCPVSGIHTQKFINPDDLLGEWYAYSQLDNSLFKDSTRFVVERTDKDFFLVRFTASTASSCDPTSIADLVTDPSTLGRGKISHNGLEADFLILYADTHHLLFYECYERRQDGTCFPKYTAVVLLTRQGLPPALSKRDRLAQLVQETCYHEDQMKLVSHSVPCEVQMETPKKCDMSNLPIQRTVDLGQLLGQWYNVARLRGAGEWSSGSAEIEVIEGSDMVRVHYVVALRGHCLPTKSIVWIPSGQGHSEWQSVIGSVRGYAAIIYLDSDHLVVYECDQVKSAAECHQGNSFFDVYSRVQVPLDYTAMSKLSHSAARMCLRVEEFEEVMHDVSCTLDHEPSINCLPHQLTLAHNFDLERATGSWYAVLRLRGSGFMNSHQMRITKSKNSGYDIHVMGSRKAACLPEQHGHLQPRMKDSADLILTTEHNSVTVQVLYYDSTYHNMIVYQCNLYTEEETCASGHGYITVFSRFLDPPEFITTEVLPRLQTGCLKDLQFETVPHGVKCDLHGEGDDEYCDYNTIQPQDDFDAGQFVGTWYHMYRLRTSAQKYASEVNYVDLMPDGKLRSYSTYYHDGKCSSTKTSMYQPTRSKGEWWYGSYGGIKIVYTDYEVAVIYVCSHSHYDDSCFPKDSEIEVLSRNVTGLSTDAEWKVKTALRSICLEIGDFDATNHEVTCNVKKIQCSFSSLPEHSVFNMEMFTGTWFPAARLRNTLSTEGDVFRVSRSKVNPSAYTLLYKMGVGGMCSKSIQSQWTRKSAATFVSSENFRKSLFRVLYTDYNVAIFYICYELFNSSTCLPGEETVYVLSHEPTITERQLSQVINKVPHTCFSQKSFEWMSQHLHCSIPPSLCPVDDLPAEKNFNVQAFRGVWYGMHQVRGHGNWQNGVVEYRVTGEGDLVITGTGTKDGVCAQPSTYISLHGDNVWDWHVVIGWMTAYVRILDASDIGDDHAVIFECDRILGDGTCDPQFAFIDVISRTQIPFKEDVRVHLRNIIRKACFEPGDFADAQHDVTCDVVRVPDIPCKPAKIPAVRNFNLIKFSGDWYAMAKLNSSSVPESSRIHIDYQGTDTLKVYFVGYRARRSCTPVSEFTFNVLPSNSARWFSQSDNFTSEFRVIWTTYEVAVVYICFNQMDDGSCPHGYEHVLVLNRNAGQLSDKMIEKIDVLSGIQDACLNRRNFRWLSQDVKCDLDLPKRQSCTVDNVGVTPAFSEEMSLGLWYMRYSLRRDSMWQNGKIQYVPTQGHNYKAFYTIGRGPVCFLGSTYGYATSIPGQFVVRFGKFPGLIKHLYQDKDYLISYTCSAVDKNGFCIPAEEGIGLFSRTLDPLPDDTIKWLANVANPDCYEPGDFVAIQHSMDCKIEDKSIPLMCNMAELPIQPNFDIDKVTGTWYAVAAHRVNDLFPSTVIRIEQSTQETYHIYFTSMGPMETSTLHVGESRFAGEYSISYGEEIQGRIKVVYTDYQFALVYECLKVDSGGKCQKGEDFFIVYARSRDLPDDAIHRMISLAGLTCLTTDQFALIHHPANCQITSPQLEDVKCKVRNVHAQDNFDLDKFLGTWFSHYKLPSSWKSLVSRYERDVSGTITTHYTGEVDGACFPERSSTIQLDTGGRAIFFGETASSKVVYTDYQYAVVMNCEEILPNGNCGKRRFISILSRDLKPIPDKKLSRLMEGVREACFEPGDLVHTPHYVNCDQQRQLPCDVSRDLIGQQSVNMADMTGVWYNMASLKHGRELGWNVIRLTDMDDTGVYTLHIAGDRNGQCHSTAPIKLQPRESQTHPGDMLILTSVLDGETSGLLRVLFTNYDMALVYVCSGGMDLERCPIGKLSILALSRTQVLSYSQMRQMVLATGQNCFQDDQFQWTDSTVECGLSVPESADCTYMYLEVANITDPSHIEGEWYTRYQLRGSPSLHSEHLIIKRLPDGDLKFYYTGSLNGRDCPKHTNIYVHQKTEDPAVFVVFADEEGIQAQVKYMYTDGTFMLVYFCGNISADGSCDIKYSYFLFMSQSKDTPIPAEVHNTIMSLYREACIEPGQIRIARQSADCTISGDAETRCNMDYFRVAGEFDMDQYCGTWYPVAKVKGSFMSDNRMFRTEARGDSYVTYGVGAMGRSCVKPAELKVNVTENGEILTYSPDYTQFIGFSKVLHWGLEHALLYHCAKPRPDMEELRCVEGYQVTVVMSRQPKLPSDAAILEMLGSVRGCIYPDELETILQDVSCPFREELPAQCLVSSVQGKASLSYGDILGKWHILYTLRNKQRAGPAQYGHSYFSMIDRTHIKGDFAFKVNGQCQSVETVYHANDDNPGEFLITIGSLPVTIKVIFQDDKHLVFYECDTVAEDGSCDEDGHFVMIFGRTTERVRQADMEKLQAVVRGVCLEMGDFMELEKEGECEIKIDRRDIGCSLSKLPVQDDFMVHKDTGHWYAVAKLKGSNFPNSLNEVGLVDYDEKQYTFYSSGKRGRGGCMPAMKKTIPFQVPGQSSVKVPISSSNHSGVWQMLYNDYRHALVFRCGHLLSPDVCALGQFYVVAYSRKQAHIPDHVIDKMFWKISPACFTWDDFEWLDLEEECPLSDALKSCRMRDIPDVENFHLDLFLGNWFSRYLLVKHTEYDSFASRYELTDNGMLKLYHNGASNGGCRRMKEYSFIIPDRNRGVFRWGQNAEKIVKVMYTDYNYAVIYTCDRVQEDDTCVPEKEFIDIIGRDISQMPVNIIEDFKQLLLSACYTPGDFVESDHTLQCDDKSCTIGRVVTQRDVTAPSLFGSWQLIARTTHISVARGPTTMEIMMGKDGNARFAMARHAVTGCQNYEVYMPVDHDNTFYYMYNNLPGLFKIIYRDPDYLILYDCFGEEPVEDFCREENQEIQLWGRKYYLEESMFERTIKIARERTCVNLNNLARVPENIACTVHKSCKFEDLVEQENFDPRSVLGSWELVAQSTFFAPDFSSGHIRLGHTGEDVGSYQFTGALSETGECTGHTGKVIRMSGKVAMYQFTYKSLRSMAKYLYVDNHHHVFIECWGDLVDGVCPVNSTAFYIFGKTVDLTENERMTLFREIRQRTFGCYDVKNIEIITSNTCQVTPQYIGRPSCKVDDIVGDKFFRPGDLSGLWFMVARSDLSDFKWDSGVLYSTVNTETGVIKITYTGLRNSRVQECLKIFSIDVSVKQLSNGYIEKMTYLQGGTTTIAQVLYIDDDTFIWYECHGTKLTPYGDCLRNLEHVEVYSRRRKVNTEQMNKLLDIINHKTCLNVEKFVFANHTNKCHLPGITDRGVSPDRANRSCKVEDIPAQKVVNTTLFSGLWYEKERTRFSPHNTWESSLSLYESQPSGRLTFRHAGTEKGLCRGPIVATAVPKAVNSGDMQLYVGSEGVAGSPWAMHFVFKVIYTDYETAVTYACKYVREDGRCSHYGQQVDILSRRKEELTPQVYNKLHQIISHTLCVDIHDFVTPVYQEDCHPLLGVLAPPSIEECPVPRCQNICPHGYTKDQNQCQTCECQPQIDEVKIPCAVPVCKDPCPSGHVRDEHGCETCVCTQDKPAEVKVPCAVPMCSDMCPGGYAKDQNGCQTCACKEDKPAEVQIPCAVPICSDMCPGGYDQDQNGCQTCACKEDKPAEVKIPCAVPMCSDQCPGGYAKDQNGCQTCACKQDEPAEVKIPCAISVCSDVCPNGYAKDENGCETCVCKQDDPVANQVLCPIPLCANYCPTGYALDDTGCQTCYCNEAEVVTEESSGEMEEEAETKAPEQGEVGEQPQENDEDGDNAALVEQPVDGDEIGDNVDMVEQPIEKTEESCTVQPARIQHGMVRYTSSNHGDRAIYECAAGYFMEGNYYTTCENGQWVGQLPSCELVFCPYYGNLNNGKVYLIGQFGKYDYKPYVKVLHDDQIEYQCNDGYQLVGPSVAYCVDGFWSPELMPRCDKMPETTTPESKGEPETVLPGDNDADVVVTKEMGGQGHVADENMIGIQEEPAAVRGSEEKGVIGRLKEWLKYWV